MTVSIRLASTSRGDPLALVQDLGTYSPGDISATFDVYISHSGTSPITGCALYIAPYTAGVYLGTATAQDDFDELIGWGDTSYPALTGGVYLNMDADGGFPPASWTTFRTGVGDSLANAIALGAEAIISGAVVAGEIDAGGEAQVRIRVIIPAAEGDVGLRYFDLKMDYSSTS